MEKRLRELEEAGAVDAPEYLEAHAKHDALNNPQTEAKAKKMLRGLGYRETDFARPAREMSGGWMMRAHLARLLVMEPDLLLLDEPTNHLDLLSLLWLQNYLKTYSGAVLMISHDRQFMDEIVENVYDIAEQRLTDYKGNYSDFLRQREANYEQQSAAYKNQQKEITALREFYGPLPLGVFQGVSGPEQAQANRADGPHRKAASRRASRSGSKSRSRRAVDSGRSAWRVSTWRTGRTGSTTGWT